MGRNEIVVAAALAELLGELVEPVNVVADLGRGNLSAVLTQRGQFLLEGDGGLLGGVVGLGGHVGLVVGKQVLVLVLGEELLD